MSSSAVDEVQAGRRVELPLKTRLEHDSEREQRSMNAACRRLVQDWWGCGCCLQMLPSPPTSKGELRAPVDEQCARTRSADLLLLVQRRGIHC